MAAPVTSRCFERLLDIPRLHRIFRPVSTSTSRQRKVSDPNYKTDLVYSRLIEHAGDKRSLSLADWDSFKSKMTLNPITFNNTIMTCLVAKQNYPLAKSFLDYLRSSSNSKPSALLLAQYMALCSDEAELLSCYNAIKSGMGGNLLLDTRTRDAVICGLCRTSLWKESLPLLESEPELCRPTSLSLNAVADAAFKHGDMDVAWDAMQKLTQPPLQIFSSSLGACLGACSKLVRDGETGKALNLVTRLLEFLANAEVVVARTVGEMLKEFYEKFEEGPAWKGTFAEIGRDGTCSSCGCLLESSDLTRQEFEELRLAVLASIMKGSDLFLNTTPRELEDFERFLSRAPSFDVVIDGLNVALKGNANSNGDKARNLLLVVKHYTLVEKRKVLVVGRKHMRKWPRNVMDQVWSHCVYYLTNDLSEDDPFLLCAAFSRGPGTVVASRDLMRNHRYKLHEDSRMGGLFDKWRRTHQEVLDVSWGKLSVLKPARHQISVQGSNAKGWHIPYDDGSELEPYDIRTTWLCLKTREQSVWHAADPRQCTASTK
ncbi:mitochondrial ribonuclease P catalytic subunit isoform X1 [Ixodes scapularis]|uniref:mitochondrial ribonuclease P catalytic subunit isoform X1 n=1 Tax=Ixodes scapularis TaxID=6945 RepID=UPI001A9FFFF9|nr:mitochondrial ribonuclease P catalytic subunit isoform X1 [Ixodes scapularis]